MSDHFDEESDGDPHGECAETIHMLETLLGWAYGKLADRSFSKMDDCLKLHELKLYFMQKGQS